MINKTKAVIFTTFVLALAVGIGGYFFGPRLTNHEGLLPNIVEAQNGDGNTTNVVGTNHAPYVDDAGLYNEFFDFAKKPNALEGEIISGVVPHHLVAGHYVAGFFDSVKSLDPEVVVVVGPNHGQRGGDNIVSSYLNWNTPYGELKTETKLLTKLEKDGLVKIKPEIMEGEHSVSSLVPFIKKIWKDAKVVPVILKNNATAEDLEKLAIRLKDELGKDSLLLASVDFSHYLTLEPANFHDELSLAVLNSGDIPRVRKLEVDSPNSLYLLLRYNELKGSKKFQLFSHTNSATILQNRNLKETTSHVIAGFSSGEPAGKDLTIQFFGDMMLERNVAKAMGTKGLDYLFDKLKAQENRFFYGMDLLVANLEGPFAPARVPTTKSIAFRFDPKLAPALAKYGFHGFSLANNHTVDMGWANVDYTKKVLKDNKLKFFGDQLREGTEYTWIAGEEMGLPEKVAIIGVNNTDHALKMAKVKEAIVEAKKQARYVIVNVHWGVEYKRNSRKAEQDLAHWFVDQGVTAVIGGHPHVVQEMEIYKGTPIFYSLGNFIFDQYFSTDTQEGISVGLTLNNGKVKDVYVFPFYGVKSQVQLMEGERKAKFFDWWNKNGRLGDNKFSDGKISLEN
ncbi:MAG TPA: AmmeMemoRadiSam system protein B [Patescibacteria group bacterium]|nr:AmmeMemoRadiSam system protein B [Patescibacteria group bacterium]